MSIELDDVCFEKLVNAIIAVIIMNELLELEEKVFYAYLTEVTTIVVDHRLRFKETYDWPGMSADQVENVKTRARDKAYQQIQQDRLCSPAI